MPFALYLSYSSIDWSASLARMSILLAHTDKDLDNEINPYPT